jgi:hypothetical protein
MTVKGIRYLLTAAIPLGLVACTVSPASNPTVSQAKVVGIASNMPAGRANKIIVGTTVFTNESSVVSVPGLNLVDGIASQLRPGLSLRQIPFPPQKKGFAGAMAAAYSPIPAKVPPRTDCDLILLLDGSTLNASGGYYNAAAGAYIPSYSNRRGLFMQEGFLLGAKVDRSAGCEFTVIIFDAKTGSRIDYALISEFEKVPKDQSLPAALLRTAAKAATRAANAAGLSSRSTAGSKAKKEPIQNRHEGCQQGVCRRHGPNQSRHEVQLQDLQQDARIQQKKPPQILRRQRPDTRSSNITRNDRPIIPGCVRL